MRIIDNMDKRARQPFINYLNRQTKEGFTALHFASFKGNVAIIRRLISEGADTDTKNNQMVNMIHIAA